MKKALLIGTIGFLCLPYVCLAFAADAEVTSAAISDKSSSPPPRLAVLGNDAGALLSYCVFQSQVYSVGVTFCSGEQIMLECAKNGENPAFWKSNTAATNCKGFGK